MLLFSIYNQYKVKLPSAFSVVNPNWEKLQKKFPKPMLEFDSKPFMFLV